MEATASAFAVVSLAIQLAESVKKLCDFWASIREAPKDIREISADLRLVSNVLTQVAYETQHVEPDTILVDALEACSGRVKTLSSLLNEIEPGFASTSSRIRKWTAFKAVLKRAQLMKFQEALEKLKSTLMLAQQNYHRYVLPKLLYLLSHRSIYDSLSILL